MFRPERTRFDRLSETAGWAASPEILPETGNDRDRPD
jgi:hypothetical protein